MVEHDHIGVATPTLLRGFGQRLEADDLCDSAALQRRGNVVFGVQVLSTDIDDRDRSCIGARQDIRRKGRTLGGKYPFGAFGDAPGALGVLSARISSSRGFSRRARSPT